MIQVPTNVDTTISKYPQICSFLDSLPHLLHEAQNSGLHVLYHLTYSTSRNVSVNLIGGENLATSASIDFKTSHQADKRQLYKFDMTTLYQLYICKKRDPANFLCLGLVSYTVTEN